MAYPRPAFDNRSPTEPDHKRPAWDPIPRHPYHSMPSTSNTPPGMVGATLFDPESEDSDVSITLGEPVATTAIPQGLPPAPPRHVLESPDAVQAHLNELNRIEDLNIKKHRRLVEKRARKDERIQRKRAAQDVKIQKIMEARARRDARIGTRRQREDASFQRFYDDLEEEETRLRHRLKRLKRGLPVDEHNVGGRSISSSSMSPPGPAYSTIPPPAKRHQTGPPGQNKSPISSLARDDRTAPPYPPTAPPPEPAPSYQFYQGGPAPPMVQHQPPYPVPYHAAPPPYSNSPHSTSSVPLPPRTAPTPHDTITYTVNGQPSSPHSVRPPPMPSSGTPSSIPPPRQTSATYDTRPPPPSTSGFATINQPTPPQPGFAAVNARPAGTPPSMHAGLAKDGPPSSLPRAAEYTPSRPYGLDSTPGSAPSSLMPSSNKRTPSTTHPYQMSEAFANRHHHCERTDSLNRGIWTWYGPGGTQDNPTAPATEMYLKCNHDGCGRIDWRTVHGLQCHIVKNHEQPKGTIGSLEKALEKYGVPVKEIDEIERRDGLGAGGTMADPKNLKLKAKKEAGGKRSPDARGTPNSGNPTPTGHSANQSFTTASPTHTATAPSTFSIKPEAGSELNGPQPRVSSGFAAVNIAWAGNSAASNAPPESRDREMHSAQASQSTGQAARPATPKSPPKAMASGFSWQASNEPPKPVSQIQAGASPTISQFRPSETNPPAGNLPTPSDQFTSASRMTGRTFGTQIQDRIDEARRLDDKYGKGHGSLPTPDTDTSNDPKLGAPLRGQDSDSGGGEQGPAMLTKTEEKDEKKADDAAFASTSGEKDGQKERDEEMKQPPLSTSDGSRSAMHSPEIPSKRVSAAGSRRGSRRSSMATANSRNTVEREKDDVHEVNKDHDRDPDGATDEDDGQTITVAGASAIERQKDKDASERTKTPPRRTATGRYMRRAK